MRMRVIQLGSYPVIVLGAAALVVLACRSGSGYLPAVPVILIAAAALVALLERVQPYERSWNGDRGDARVDAAHLASNVAVSQLSLVGFGAASAAWSGVGVWPAGWPFWLQVMLALVVVDLGLYGVHRASHGVGWLWRLHAIHHSPTRLYWVNGQRRHLVHELVEGAPGIAVLWIAGAPIAAYACAIAIVTVHLMLQHANIDYRLGPLTRVVAAAETHRWHHQRRWRDVQGNYGAVLALWDVVFGTVLPQRGRAPIDVGMDDEPDLPASFAGQLVWPFKGRACQVATVVSADGAMPNVVRNERDR